MVQLSWVHLDTGRRTFAFLHGYALPFLRPPFSYLAVLAHAFGKSSLRRGTHLVLILERVRIRSCWPFPVFAPKLLMAFHSNTFTVLSPPATKRCFKS